MIRIEVSSVQVSHKDRGIVKILCQMIMKRRGGPLIWNVLVVILLNEIRWRAEGKAGTDVLNYVVCDSQSVSLERSNGYVEVERF